MDETSRSRKKVHFGGMLIRGRGELRRFAMTCATNNCMFYSALMFAVWTVV